MKLTIFNIALCFSCLGCSLLNKKNNYITAERSMYLAYARVVSDENEWFNRSPVYSLDAIPIEGDPENQKYIVSNWTFPYSSGNAKNEFEYYAKTSGLPREQILKLLAEKYGITSAYLDLSQDLVNPSEIKNEVWYGRLKCSEYYLWRHHPSVDPKIKKNGEYYSINISERRKNSRIQFEKKYKSLYLAESKGVNPDSIQKDYWKLSVLLASYARTYFDESEVKISQEKIIKEMELKYGRISVFK